MSVSTAVLERTAWLFTRGDESVRIEMHPQAGGIFVFIHGPGEASAQYTFTESNAVTIVIAERERTLLECGYHLQGVVERRSTGERRASPRGVGDRRRGPRR
jgi:hypothetical protein